MKDQQKCPIEVAMSAVGGKWKPAILYRLRTGPHRFGALRRTMPWISERVLSRQLRELEAEGLVLRTDHREVPLRVDYRLTDYGRTVIPILDDVARWGASHIAFSDAGGGPESR